MNYYLQNFAQIDFRKNPELYRVGKGEQGVLSVEPYKSEILPFWRFKNPTIAQTSADHIFTLFATYLELGDFVGADMARKFLQMGYTRARRYANHKSGRKYGTTLMPDSQVPTQLPPYKDPKNIQHYLKTKTQAILPPDPDPIKAEAAQIFYTRYCEAKENGQYQQMKKAWQAKYG